MNFQPNAFQPKETTTMQISQAERTDVGEDKAKVAIARVRGALHVEALPNKQERFWPQKETPST